MIYLDNAATLPMREEVKQAIRDYLNEEHIGNPSASHNIGVKEKNIIDECTKKIADILDCDEECIYYTSGASEGISTIGNLGNFICSPKEHDSVKLSCVDRTHYVYNNNNFIYSPINNVTGEYINPLKTYDQRICVDATQYISNERVDFNNMRADYLAFSSHKIGGMQGTGVLISKEPLPYGIINGEQNHGIRGGTYNTLGILTTCIALEIAQNIDYLNKKRLNTMALRDMITENFHIRKVDYITPVPLSDSCPAITCYCFKGISGEGLMNYLSDKEIYVSTGSACTSGNLTHSYVLDEYDIPEDYINGAIRVSTSAETTGKEVCWLTNAVFKYVNQYKI